MDTAVQKTIPRLRWIRIIPPAIIIYIVAYMDRMNIGFAMAGGMNEALGLSLGAAGFAAGVSSLGYMLLQVPGGHIAEHRGARIFIMWTMIAWGGISFLTGFVQNAWQLHTMRFLLGVAEGGVYPAILVIVGNWFPQKELGRANGLFLCSLPFSAAVTNPISGWIVSHYDWRALFFFEGVVSLTLIAVWMPLVSDSPEKAKWISKEEKEYLLTTLAAERVQREANFRNSGAVVKASYGQLFANRYLWIMSVIYFCYAAGSIAYVIWLPTLLKRLMKMSLTNVGWLSALPLAAAVSGVYLFGAMSDRRGNRRLWCSLALLGFGVGLGLAMQFTEHMWLCYGLLVMAGVFSKAMMGPCWSMPALVFPPGVAGGARGVINGLGNVGPAIAIPVVGWLAGKTGSMNYGIYSLVGISILGGLVTMLMPKATAGYKYQTDAKTATAKA
jgi:sugar phosphate permease